jgi:hypothetical protein
MSAASSLRHRLFDRRLSVVLRKQYLLSLSLALATLLLAGCPTRTSISAVNRDPGKYAGREVTLAGRVTDSFGALGNGVFQLDDGSGTMWVLSQGFGVPGNGAKVAVTGTVSQGFSFGGRSFAIILKQTQRRH